jgi:16S rRNA (guanine(966)-N(2))-methyltransferase RsmD
MRIISGSLKGCRILAPKKLPVRPTTDRSKEALFNILTNWVTFNEIKILDLFSGTGNISYEFGSRGVKEIVAVDQNKYCTRFIEETSTKFGLNIEIINQNVFKFLQKPHQNFDVIFADPPYDLPHSDFEKIVDLIFQGKQLKEEGMLILEHSKEYKFEEHPNFESSRNYGSNTFSFFE